MRLVSSTLLAGIVGLGVVACSSAAARELERRDAGRVPLGTRALDRTLAVGTLIEAQIRDSRTATVTADVGNARRWVVIPAGSQVRLGVPRWKPAVEADGTDAKIALDLTSVTVRGHVYPVGATVELTPGAAHQTAGDVVAVARGTRIMFVLQQGLTVAR